MKLHGRLDGRGMLALSRPHLVAAAALAAIACGFVLNGRPAWLAGGVAAFDVLLQGVLNRVSDVPEDKSAGVPGTLFVEQNAGALMRILAVALLVSLIGAKPLGTRLLFARVAFHGVGFAYSFPTVTERFKEIPVLRTVVPPLLFALAAVGYPLAL